MRNLDVTLLRSFVAVADAGSVTAAAGQLHLTQAAVSQQIKRLEEQLETVLFERQNRRLTLSGAGERLVAHAKRLLALNDEIWQMMRAPEMMGEVRLGVPSDIVTPYIPPVLAAFDRACPGVRVTLIGDNSYDLLLALAADEIDLCLTTEENTGAGGEMLLQEPLIWTQVQTGGAATQDPLPIAIGDDRCRFRRPVVRALTASGVDFRVVCNSNDVQTVLATVQADLAVTPLLPSSLPVGLEPVSPAVGLPSLPMFRVNLYLQAGTRSCPVEAMATHIRRRFATRLAAA